MAVTEVFSPQVRLFRAARIHTMSAGAPEVFAVLSERIVATGALEDLRARFPEATVTDFGSATVIPGLNDAHMHPSGASEGQLNVDLSPSVVRSAEQLAAALRTRAQTTPAGDWVIGTRYDHVKTTAGRVLERGDLDEVSTDHPILVTQIAGHWGVANTVALERAGLGDDAVAPPGGELGRDAAGHLDGVLYETALTQFRRANVPAASVEDLLKGLELFSRSLHAAGLTSVGDAAVQPSGVRLFQEAERRGRLSLRVNMLLRYEFFDELDRLGLTTGFGSDRLRLGGIKLVVDGAIAGRTCWMEEPFEDSDDDHGIQVMSDAEVHRVVGAVHASGSRVGVHANGDRAIALLLDAVERAQSDHPDVAVQHRIEHCTLINDELVERIRRAGMMAVPFGSYVNFHGEKLLDWYGPRRIERMFAHRRLLDAGIPVAGSSDFGAGPFEPLLALQSCVTRESADGTVLGASQRISAAEALALYTVGAAHASGEDHDKGRLVPGYLADFVVLAEDPLAVDPHRLATIPVLSTWVGGERVWEGD